LRGFRKEALALFLASDVLCHGCGCVYDIRTRTRRATPTTAVCRPTCRSSSRLATAAPTTSSRSSPATVNPLRVWSWQRASISTPTSRASRSRCRSRSWMAPSSTRTALRLPCLKWPRMCLSSLPGLPSPSLTVYTLLTSPLPPPQPHCRSAPHLHTHYCLLMCARCVLCVKIVHEQSVFGGT